MDFPLHSPWISEPELKINIYAVYEEQQSILNIIGRSKEIFVAQPHFHAH